MPPEAEAAAAQAAAAAAAASASSSAGGAGRGRLGSALGALGNALFFGAVGAGGVCGYYTLRYTADQVDTMVEQTKEPENSFPGSPVRPPACAVHFGLRPCCCACVHERPHGTAVLLCICP